MNYWQMVALIEGMIAAGLVTRKDSDGIAAIFFVSAVIFAVVGSK